MTSIIVRLAFAKGADQIHVGLTKNGNKTFVGEIVHSDDLVVSHYNKLFEVDGNSCVGSVGTICIASDEVANDLIEDIEAIQAARPVNARGNKYPFVFLRVLTEEDIIFNKGVGGAPHRLTFLDVECINVEADAPDEIVAIEPPATHKFAERSAVVVPRSSYGTVKYRPQVLAPHFAQRSAARRGLEVSSSATQKFAERSAVPSFNRNVVETPQVNAEGVVEKSLEGKGQSRQDKLNAIAVAMKAAGMSSLEIAQALKAELELVF
ncbi:hypothetical protein C7B62_09525 [Pleurocapsa sp. CCALA 161]|uniref:hypothetical protein n=1 Tax=Pleurocapsa sp. CCALA 161 TaxID=2107688 RepID=UPI000D061A96|nr:hypothetical protein [Pleurocapsa sp. CCALA 161]PSB10364.1 hypothetical protein C7B62_09525 [Pleurocapsa sp. CCALA 161]